MYEIVPLKRLIAYAVAGDNAQPPLFPNKEAMFYAKMLKFFRSRIFSLTGFQYCLV